MVFVGGRNLTTQSVIAMRQNTGLSRLQAFNIAGQPVSASQLGVQ